MTINKSLLTAAVLGAVSAAVSGAAFAADNSSTFCKPGFYAGVQGGRSDTFYSSNELLVQAANEDAGTTLSTTQHFDTTTGAVTETQLSGTYSYNQLSGQKVDDIGIGGRVYAGYQFNPYFALEAGYTQYAKTTFGAQGNVSSVTTNSTQFSDGSVSQGVTYYDTNTERYYGEVTEHAIDLVAKGTLPLQYGFGLYAKAGMAFIAADRHINSNTVGTATQQQVYPQDTVSTSAAVPVNVATTSNVGINEQGTLYTKSYQAFRPVGGVGINYTIPNTNISLDASYTRVFSYGAIPNASLLALGAEYKFA